jgi:hypothetical protein
MKSLILTLIMVISTPVFAKDLYCVSEGAAGSRVMMKISRLPGDLEALLDSLPQLKNVRNPASENGMDDIMKRFFASDKDYTFSVRVGQSKYDDVIVKGLLGGRWENESSIAFMTDPNKPGRIIKFQLAMNGLKGTLDYKGLRGNLSKQNLNCSHEATEFK